MKKPVILTALFVLLQVSTTSALAGTSHHVLFYPEEHQGRTVVFEKAKIGGPVLKDPHTGFYGLNVQIGAHYTPGVMYRSQLNFVVESPEMVEKLTAHLDAASKIRKPCHEHNLMDHLLSTRACPVKLTATIQKISGYWMAVISKIRFLDQK